MDQSLIPPKKKLSVVSDAVLAKFAAKMKDIELKEEERKAKERAEAAGIPYADLRAFPISQEALALIPKEIAMQGKAVCFIWSQVEFRLASPVADSNKERIAQIIHQIGERHHAEGGVYLVSEESFERAIKMYDRLPVVKPVQKGVAISYDDLQKFSSSIAGLKNFGDAIKNLNITDLVSAFLSAALSLDASDVHIEAEKDSVSVRFRIDGVLEDAARLPKEEWDKIISRIKLASSLKLNITDQPQDGSFIIRGHENEIDVRVSTLPTVHGESVVMRILKPLAAISLTELGLSGRNLRILQEQIARPTGMIITTGPTGSGKTTTLYAVLRELNKPDVKIITFEDPVEYKMPGISQSQIDPSKDYTFAAGLKALMRQDPDVAMVGEIRDLETAEVAIQAALTGHLIISTIHSNNASGAIPRFLSMGAAPFLLGPSLKTVIGQRLVRKLCANCKVPAALSDSEMERIKEVFSKMPAGIKAPQLESLKFFASKGCEKCGSLGYKGRTGIFEIFTVDSRMLELILKGSVSEREIEEAALEQGMTKLVQDGILKAAEGITSIQEVFRVSE